VSLSSLPDALSLHKWWRGQRSHHMMGRGLERGAGCLPNLDPGQNAPLRCMQCTTYHRTTRLLRVHRVVYVTPLGELYSRRDRQALWLHQCGIMWHIVGQKTNSWYDVDHPPPARCDLHREVHWSTLCIWYVQHIQEFHTRDQYLCN